MAARVVSMAEAPGVILAHARGLRERGVVVAIGGPVGAGKSTLARALSACVLSTDDYLPDYERVPEAERDDPGHADIPRLLQDLALLRAGREARAPVWSYATHARSGEKVVTPAPVIVVEGIHALFGPARLAADVGVFVDAPRGVRWERWEYLESTGQRGWGVAAARAFFDGVAEPTFDALRARYVEAAEFLVANGAGVPS